MAPKKPPNSGKLWTPKQETQLRKELASNMQTRVAALHLGRTPGAFQQKANEMGLSTKPVNQ